MSHTHRQTHTRHTGTNRLTLICNKYILTPLNTYTQQPAVLHWINNLLIQKFTDNMSLLFKNYSLVEVMYLQIQ